MKKTIIFISLLFTIIGCMRTEDQSLPFKSFGPQELNDGIEISSPSNQNVDSTKLIETFRRLTDDENLWSIRSLLVLRNGKLIAENYFRDEEDISQRHLIWSFTKQILSSVTGIAIQEGLIKSIDDPISDYLEECEQHRDKANITIRQLISMQSGIDYDNDGVGGETDMLLRQIPDDMVNFILSRPMRNTPGASVYYNDGDPHLLAAIIQRASKKEGTTWVQEVFFDKLGIENIDWLLYKDGTMHGGYGIEANPRELAKFALCIADSGAYNGQQIIPKGWLAGLTATIENKDQDFSFGYYWWSDLKKGIHFAWGHGGQFAFIVPQKDLAIIVTSIPNTQGKYQIGSDEIMPYVDEIILSAQ